MQVGLNNSSFHSSPSSLPSPSHVSQQESPHQQRSNRSIVSLPQSVAQDWSQQAGNTASLMLPQPSVAAAAAVSASMELALRAEVKRLREEVADLRREALRAKTLEAENETLRTVNLMQSEEKVPIRLRELELENQRLKRMQRLLEEKVSGLEGDRRYRELLVSTSADGHQKAGLRTDGDDSSSAMDRSGSGIDVGGGAGWTFPSFASPPSAAQATFHNNLSMVGNATMLMGAPRSVLVLKQGVNPCSQCSTRVSAMETAFDVERQKLTKENRELQTQLEAALAEIRAVEAWVAPLVHSLQMYPRTAESQPLQQLHSFASPTRYTGETTTLGARILGTPSASLHAAPSIATPPPATRWANPRTTEVPQSSYLQANHRRSGRN